MYTYPILTITLFDKGGTYLKFNNKAQYVTSLWIPEFKMEGQPGVYELSANQ